MAFDLRLSRRTVVGEPPADCRHDETDVLPARRISVLDRSSQQIRASGFASIKASGAPLTSRQCRQGLAELIDRAGARQAKESTGSAPVCTRAVMPGLGRSASLCRRCPDPDSPLALDSRLIVLRHLQDVLDGPATTCNARGRRGSRHCIPRSSRGWWIHVDRSVSVCRWHPDSVGKGLPTYERSRSRYANGTGANQVSSKVSASRCAGKRSRCVDNPAASSSTVTTCGCAPSSTSGCPSMSIAALSPA